MSILNIIDTTEQHLNLLMDNIYLSSIVKIVLIMYGCIIAPKLPSSILRIIDNIFVKIFIIFIIVYITKHDLGVALLIAICFIITLQMINKNKLLNLTEIKQLFIGGNSTLMPISSTTNLPSNTLIEPTLQPALMIQNTNTECINTSTQNNISNNNTPEGYELESTFASY